MLKRVGPNRYVVFSRDGKTKLTGPLSRASAIKRLASMQASDSSTQASY